jgi:siroheme synthase (precorrin-2 oxidase/ferrochelatase)
MYQSKSKDELEEIENNVDPYIEESIEEIFNGVKYFDINDEIQTVFIIVTPTQEHELKHYAYALGTKTVFVDITTQALHRFFNTNDPEVLKMMADDKGVAMVEEFITNNTSVDEVLDKIGLYGIGSLNEIDSTFLKQP